MTEIGDCREIMRRIHGIGVEFHVAQRAGSVPPARWDGVDSRSRNGINAHAVALAVALANAVAFAPAVASANASVFVQPPIAQEHKCQ